MKFNSKGPDKKECTSHFIFSKYRKGKEKTGIFCKPHTYGKQMWKSNFKTPSYNKFHEMSNAIL